MLLGITSKSFSVNVQLNYLEFVACRSCVALLLKSWDSAPSLRFRFNIRPKFLWSTLNTLSDIISKFIRKFLVSDLSSFLTVMHLLRSYSHFYNVSTVYSSDLFFALFQVLNTCFSFLFYFLLYSGTHPSIASSRMLKKLI